MRDSGAAGGFSAASEMGNFEAGCGVGIGAGLSLPTLGLSGAVAGLVLFDCAGLVDTSAALCLDFAAPADFPGGLEPDFGVFDTSFFAVLLLLDFVL